MIESPAPESCACSPGGTNRLFAWESGVDGFLSSPVHVDTVLAEIQKSSNGRSPSASNAAVGAIARATPVAASLRPRRRPLRRRLGLTYSGRLRGCSSAAEHQLQLRTRVRFPSPAPMRHARSTWASIGSARRTSSVTPRSIPCSSSSSRAVIRSRSNRRCSTFSGTSLPSRSGGLEGGAARQRCGGIGSSASPHSASRIKEARRAVGDDGQAQRVIRSTDGATASSRSPRIPPAAAPCGARRARDPVLPHERQRCGCVRNDRRRPPS